MIIPIAITFELKELIEQSVYLNEMLDYSGKVDADYSFAFDSLREAKEISLIKVGGYVLSEYQRNRECARKLQ